MKKILLTTLPLFVYSVSHGAIVYANYDNLSIANPRGTVATATGGTVDGVSFTVTATENGAQLGNNSNGGGIRVPDTRDFTSSAFTNPAGVDGSSVQALGITIDTDNALNGTVDFVIEFITPVRNLTLQFFNTDFSWVQFTGDHTEELVSGGSSFVYSDDGLGPYDGRVLGYNSSNTNVATTSNQTIAGYGSVQITPTSGEAISRVEFSYRDNRQIDSQVDGQNFTFFAESIPEPSSISLIGIGLLGFVMRRSRIS